MQPDKPRRNHNTSAMDAFMDNIGKIPLMTPEEEIHLGKQVRRMMELRDSSRELTRQEKREVVKGERAKNRFVQANLRLVVYIVKRSNRKTSFLEMIDLVQECSIGLIRAVELFDPKRGYKFSTYAYWWCRQAINRSYTTQERAIRRPVNVAENASKVTKIMHQETSRLGRTPTLDELAAATGIKRSELELMATRGSHCVSLDKLAGEKETSTFLEMLRDDALPTQDELLDSFDDQDNLQLLQSALPQLSKEEQVYIIRRFGLDGKEPASWKEMGQEVHLSRERVRQLTLVALNKLRYHMTHKPEAIEPEPIEEVVEEPVVHKAAPIDLEVLQVATEAWSSPVLQSA